MNPGLGGQDLRTAFEGDDYKVMLVANKFQTGFDQPLLWAIYVDKQLSGATAAQTLSRLNRVYTTPGGVDKTQPFVLDFVNDPEEIRKSFEPYYTDAFLETATDPNLVHDVSAKLDQAAIFTDDEVDAVADIWVEGGKGAHNALNAAMGPAKQRFKTAYTTALTANGGAGDKAATDELDMFRKDVSTFVRLYDFMSQIVDYADADLEKRSIFLRLLERLIRDTNWSNDVDLGDVSLVNVKQVDTGKHQLSLGDKKGLTGLTAAGSAAKKDPVLVAMEKVIERLNELFGDEDFSPAAKVSFLEMALRMMLENEVLLTQAAANTDTQFRESPDLKPELLGSVADGSGVNQKITDYIFGDGPSAEGIIFVIAGAFWHEVQGRVAAGRGFGE